MRRYWETPGETDWKTLKNPTSPQTETLEWLQLPRTYVHFLGGPPTQQQQRRRRRLLLARWRAIHLPYLLPIGNFSSLRTRQCREFHFWLGLYSFCVFESRLLLCLSCAFLRWRPRTLEARDICRVVGLSPHEISICFKDSIGVGSTVLRSTTHLLRWFVRKLVKMFGLPR